MRDWCASRGGTGLMFPRLFLLQGCTNQELERKVMRNGVCMTGLFSALGPTNVEISHAHARDKDCTGLYSEAVESDSCGTPPVAVRSGKRGDGRRASELV